MLFHIQIVLFLALLFGVESANIFKLDEIAIDNISNATPDWEDINVLKLDTDQEFEVAIVGTSNATLDLEDTDFQKAKRYNPKSTIIRNDVIWYDEDHKIIKANRCGTISKTKINGNWYMVGSQSARKWLNGGDIFFYKSATLGSHSWQKVGKMYDFTPESNLTSSSCEINQRYDDPNIIILHCRMKIFISYNGIEGDYIMDLIDVPKSTDGGGTLKFGGSSIYREDNDLYLVTSRLQVPEGNGERIRWATIYKLNSTWTGLDHGSPSITWIWQNFESPMVTKRDGWYYIFASRTKGWKDSATYYRKARSLEGLAGVADSEVVMHPANTPEIQSMGSQFCFFQEFDDGKWIFGGRRHPAEAPESFAWKYGKNVMTPATFIDGVPHVYWKYWFDWTTYNYTNPKSDYHNHLGYGHTRVPCVDSTEIFWLPGNGRYGNCGWLKKINFHARCNKHKEIQINCPVTCKVFGCGK